MTSLTNEPSEETTSSALKSIVRKLARWYGGIIGVYAPIHTIYGWLQGAELVKMPFAYLVFNICSFVGLVSLVAFFPALGAASVGFIVGESLGEGDSAVAQRTLAKRTAWLFAIFTAVGGSIYFLFQLSKETFEESFKAVPKFDRVDWFFAVLGATVLVTTYVFFGERLVGLLNESKDSA